MKITESRLYQELITYRLFSQENALPFEVRWQNEDE